MRQKTAPLQTTAKNIKGPFRGAFKKERKQNVCFQVTKNTCYVFPPKIPNFQIETVSGSVSSMQKTVELFSEGRKG